MQAFNARQISLYTHGLEPLFADISCSLSARMTGLIGRNGIGKSLLGEILCGLRAPDSGTVERRGICGIYRQQQEPKLLTAAASRIDGPSSQVPTMQTGSCLSQCLGLATRLQALTQIEQGCCDSHWFEQLNDDWQVRQTFCELCRELGLPAEPELEFERLSGGQQAKLKLWSLFQSEADWLLLDEPSNHLDRGGRQWLRQRMSAFSGQILLISHDIDLLRQMDEIWELNSSGLDSYGGNYDSYWHQHTLAQQALERRLENVDKARRQARKQAQLSRERAQQRAAKGEKLARSGSQAKVLLDRQKERAGANAAAMATRERRHQRLLDSELAGLKQQCEQRRRQNLTLGRETHGQPVAKQTLVRLLDAVLPYGSREPINLTLSSGEKLRLAGANGSGKSSLLRVLQARLALSAGQVQLNGHSVYLDQHFSLLKPEWTLLETLQRCAQVDSSPIDHNQVNHSLMDDSQRRTLLAQIGFRAEQVHRTVACLSGGEKMKLAMLYVSHQRGNPLLLLDEPDNHLDIESKALLAAALAAYPGAFILVSHDEEFVAQTGIEEAFSLPNSGS
ncbi:ATP-binding cassette domain-containing protein [Shewanella chilikensis]|uniref:ATP-binding cassette domain-containing protein n=2 Tax=Shewanella chilikensis TaxID=558541 RepID=UPI00399BB6D6